MKKGFYWEDLSPAGKLFWGIIFPLIFVVIGAVFSFLGIRNLKRASDSTNWPSVQGNIVRSDVRSSTNTDDKTTYRAKISYEFTVEGITYNGNRVAYGDYGSSNSSHAHSIVSRYPKGKNISVYYMPGNPDESVLEPGVKGQTWLLPAVGFAWFCISLLIMICLPLVKKQPKLRGKELYGKMLELNSRIKPKIRQLKYSS